MAPPLLPAALSRAQARALFEWAYCIPDLLPALASHGLLHEVLFPAVLMRAVQQTEREAATLADEAAATMATADEEAATLATDDAAAATVATATWPAAAQMPDEAAWTVEAATATTREMRPSAPTHAALPGLALMSVFEAEAEVVAELRRLAREGDKQALRERLREHGVTTIGRRLRVEAELLAAGTLTGAR